MTPEAVVFDIGNVLVEWNPERFYDARISAARRRALFAEVDLAGMNESVDLGHPFRPSVEALAAAHPEWAPEIMLWHDAWLDMCTPVIAHSVHLLRALRRAGVPVFALSNFGAETFVVAQTAYPFLNEFDGRWISAHLEMMKPDPAIYARLEAESGVAPGALVFADDKPENVAAAEARGWRGHVFEGPEGWAARLVSEGLLTEGEAAMPGDAA